MIGYFTNELGGHSLAKRRTKMLFVSSPYYFCDFLVIQLDQILAKFSHVHNRSMWKRIVHLLCRYSSKCIMLACKLILFWHYSLRIQLKIKVRMFTVHQVQQVSLPLSRIILR